MREKILLAALIISVINCSTCACEDAVITIMCDKTSGVVDGKIFGNNFVGYDPVPCKFSEKKYEGHSNYGAGIWDSKWGKPVDDVINLAKEAGVSVARFPGGCGSHHYDWHAAIGNKRQTFLYGIDEFLLTCKLIFAEPVITISYFTGTCNDAADLVEYLNAPNDGINPGGGVDWAAIRAKNGHPAPYNVKYFEIGNEVYHGDHEIPRKVSALDYSRRYLTYYNAMKAIDSSIKIGVVLSRSDWNENVMSIVKDSTDFGILHVYPSPGLSNEQIVKANPNDVVAAALGSLIFKYNIKINEAVNIATKYAGRGISLAITEYNVGIAQESPYPYRHSLGAALINAELLRILMDPENRIIMANFWNFVNEYWGMVCNRFGGDYKTLYNSYFKRPSFFVYKIYNEHFGDILLKTVVLSDGYDLQQYDQTPQILADASNGRFATSDFVEQNWIVTPIDGIDVSATTDVLSINFVKPKALNYYHCFKTAKIEADTFYRLSGYIRTDQLDDLRGVSLEIQDGRGWKQTHSAADTDTVTGTADWQYFEVMYRTLPDATDVKIFARRVADAEPVKGMALFKGVKLEKFIPSDKTIVPYLSVNSSLSADGRKVFIIVINKNLTSEITSTINVDNFTCAKSASAWVLNGPSVEATNEINHDNVKVTHKQVEIKSNPFQYTFEPHSLTAIEIERAQ